MRIAIISPNRDAYSETFIRAHIERLPNVALVLTDGHLPKRDGAGGFLMSGSLYERTERKLFGANLDQQLRDRIAATLKGSKVDLVLAEYGPTGEAMLEVCQRLGIPLVTHFHGVDAFHTKLLAEQANYKRILATGAANVVVSREMEQQLLSLGARRAQLFYNCYGIDVTRFIPGDAAKAEKHFVAVGRFVDKKAPTLTLLAFQRAWAKDPSMRLTMVGTGPLWNSTRLLAEAIGLKDVVAFPGVLAPEDVAKLMRSARAFVQHSVISADNDHEGTPLSVLEAMACALPVIATRHAGIPDVVEHEERGLLSEERDIDAMASSILRIAGDPALAGQYGRAGRTYVEQHHRVEDSIKALHAILLSAAKR